jgi:hypothetical protein
VFTSLLLVACSQIGFLSGHESILTHRTAAVGNALKNSDTSASSQLSSVRKSLIPLFEHDSQDLMIANPDREQESL